VSGIDLDVHQIVHQVSRSPELSARAHRDRGDAPEAPSVILFVFSVRVAPPSRTPDPRRTFRSAQLSHRRPPETRAPDDTPFCSELRRLHYAL
jgi:hypothetical protein